MTGEVSHNVKKTNLTSFIYLQTTIIITVCIHYMYSMYTAYVQYVYSICTVCIQHMYSMYTACIQYMYSMYTVYVHNICLVGYYNC